MPVRTRQLVTLTVTVAIATLLTVQHLTGGVPSHSFLARDDMPSISNWWGLLTLPALTWLSLSNVASRLERGAITTRTAVLGGVGAGLFGLLLAVSFTLGYAEIPRLQVRALPLIALVVPVSRAECLLGFVLAMSYTFGGVLPLVVGSVFALMGAVIYEAPRWVARRLRISRGI